MDTIYNLQKRADELRKKTETDSITPEDVGGLHADTLAYMADMEQNMDGLGIRRVYASKAAMTAEGEAPTATNGKLLRYGQLVAVFDAANTTQAESGNIYAWQKGTGEEAWLLMGNISGIVDFDNKIAAEAAAREAADAAVQAVAEGVVGRIDLADIDAVPADIDKARAMAKDMLHSRWTLTYRSALNVGVVDVFSDNAGHQLTQMLTTHYKMNDGVMDFTGHDDDAVYVYWRSYNISSPYLSNDKGTWTAWKEYVPGTVTEGMEAIDEAAAAAQTAADKAQQSADTAQTTADAAQQTADKAQAAVDALAATKGQAGGLAPMDENMQVPMQYVPDGAVEVLEFSGTVAGVTAQEQSTADVAGIVFDTVAGCFYAYAQEGTVRTYYMGWYGWERYQNAMGGTPYTGKLYVDTAADAIYRWTGTAMRQVSSVVKQVSLSQDEYDALVAAGAVDAETIYNVMEDE